jgi:hypothetical protein
MQSWQNSLHAKINRLRLGRWRKRRGHLVVKNELRETQAWCAAKADLARPKDCFRDKRLRPQLLPPSRLDAVSAAKQASVQRSPRFSRFRDGHRGWLSNCLQPGLQPCLRHV